MLVTTVTLMIAIALGVLELVIGILQARVAYEGQKQYPAAGDSSLLGAIRCGREAVPEIATRSRLRGSLQSPTRCLTKPEIDEGLRQNQRSTDPTPASIRDRRTTQGPQELTKEPGGTKDWIVSALIPELNY